jgi:hypothetical protein
MPFSARQGFTAGTAGNNRRTGASANNASVVWSKFNVTLDTTTKKFGAGSLDIVNVNEYLYSADEPTWWISGTGDFTLEWWQYIPTLSGHSLDCNVFGTPKLGGLFVALSQQSETNGLSSVNPRYLHIGATQTDPDLDYWDISTNGGSDWQTNQWYFCALQRKSAVMSFWLNGSLKTRTTGGNGSAASYDFVLPTGSFQDVKLGNNATTSRGAGEILLDEWCVSNSWRYADATADIPVPTAPFTVDTFTTQLMHLDVDPFVNDTGS